MKKKLFILLQMLLLASGLVSCKKWLDIKPDEKVYIEDALSDYDGFQQALAGIYNTMSKPGLYGEELKYGLVDVMAGYWTFDPTTHDYYYAKKLDYNYPNVRDKVDSIWVGLYSSIRQSNLILDNISKISGNKNYNLVKGEALGLRAYCHLELFKLFGPIVKTQGLNTLSIPYYTTATKVPNKFLTSQQCLDQIETDLQEAAILLKDDPMIASGRIANTNSSNIYNSLLDRRGTRMNYYAVKALLARKSLWQGDLSTAGTRAQEVIDLLKVSNAVRLLVPSDIETLNLPDIRFSVENIFALYINKINEYTKIRFEQAFHNEYRILKPDYAGFLKNLYEQGTGSTLDYRLNKWNISSTYFNKYFLVQQTTGDFYKQYEIQMINLPELYFMVAEASLSTNPTSSVTTLNVIRAARNIPALSTVNTTETIAKGYLLDEVRREYMGDGFLFTFYKRWNNDILRNGGNIAASADVFVLPKPNDELIYNTNN